MDVRQGGGVLATHGTALLFRQPSAAEFNKLLGGFTKENPVHPSKGRTFSTQFGHNFSVFSVQCVAQATLDGLQYVCGDLQEGK